MRNQDVRGGSSGLITPMLARVAAHFDRSAEGYALKYLADTPRHIFEHEKRERLRLAVRWIRQYAQFQAEGDLLDVGCGDGRLVGEVLGRERAWRATGVDISSSMIDCARTSAAAADLGRRATWQVGDLRATSARFDIVVSLGVIGYQGDQAAFLRALMARVRPGGLLIFSFGNAASITRRMRVVAQRLRRGARSDRDVRFRSLRVQAVEQTVRAAGFERFALHWLCFGLGLPRNKMEVEFSRWCETHCQRAVVSRLLAQVALVCYQRSVSRDDSSGLGPEAARVPVRTGLPGPRHLV